MSEKKMHRITAFDSVGARHAAYQRQLEQLAAQCEDLMGVLRDEAKDNQAIQYVADTLEKALERVYAASRVK